MQVMHSCIASRRCQAYCSQFKCILYSDFDITVPLYFGRILDNEETSTSGKLGTIQDESGMYVRAFLCSVLTLSIYQPLAMSNAILSFLLRVRFGRFGCLLQM